VKRSRLIDYGLVAVLAIALALALQAFVIKPYRIPSVSMADTLQRGDRVLVNRLAYHVGTVRRGDVLVFRWPRDRGLVFIKRVIGLPGDTVALRNGRVYVNGRLLDEPYVRRLNGRPEPTLAAGQLTGAASAQPWGLDQPYTVPADRFFMLGDNRADSDDSRDWGTISRRDIIGKAIVIYWPFGRWNGL